ncbi:hypothetical protein [Williamsia sp. 1135]|uniref:hypothetical protein n=1 Tax=Williamsia sp. 1135 TaxID=1889262 RepID=UPI003204AEE4
MSTPTVIAVTEDLTTDWLTGVIGGGAVAAFETTRIGTGQMSESHRVSVRYDDGDGPESVVLKIAASDETSRSTGVSLGLYEREVRFYADIAASIAPAPWPAATTRATKPIRERSPWCSRTRDRRRSATTLRAPPSARPNSRLRPWRESNPRC